MAGLEFGVLGPLQVSAEGRPLALGGRKQRALLAVLLLHANTPVSTEGLIDALWGERPPVSAANSVHIYVSALRKALGADRLERAESGYVLRVEPGELDLERFERLVAEARTADDAAAAAASLGDAIGLVRGAPLADVATAIELTAEVARLEEIVLSAREERLHAEIAAGGAAAAVPELEQLVREHPMRERLRAGLMLALYRSGRQADALTVYRDASRLLRDELGLAPGRELQDLERAILTHDESLDAAPAPIDSREPERRWPLAATAAGGAVLLAAAAALGWATTRDSGRSVEIVGDALAVIDAGSERLIDGIPVGTAPEAVAAAAGAVWVANVADDTVTRVDPRTRRVVRTIRLDFQPTGLSGAKGRLWVVGVRPGAQSLTVGPVDPEFDAFTELARVDNVTTGGAGAISVRGDRIWVAPSFGLLTRLGLDGKALERIDPSSGASGVAVGSSGVWLTDTNAGTVVRVDATGLATPLPVGRSPDGIALGSGAVWVADTSGDVVVRIDEATGAVAARIPVGRSPRGITVGAGAVWVANSGDGTVSRIDPRTNAARSISVGGSPQRLVVAGGKVWVTVAPAAPAASGTRGGVLRIAAESPLGTLDPALGSASFQLLYPICAKLLDYPDRPVPEGTRLVPEVATALPRISPDGRTYTFTIRPGFGFSPPSRETVTAATFKYSIERSLHPAMHGPAGGYLQEIVGAGAYMTGRAKHIRGIVARGRTLTIRLSRAVPDLPARIAQPFFCAVPRNTPIDPKGVTPIPSAGPYHVASYTRGQALVLRRNPRYGGRRPRNPREISIVFGRSGETTVRQVEAGTVDYALDGAPASERERLLRRYGPGTKHPRYLVHTAPEIDYLALNVSRPLFSDVRLRRAVNYAIDRRALASLGSAFRPIPSVPDDRYVPPGVPGSGGAHAFPLSPDLPRARALAGPDRRRAVMYVCNVPPCLQIAQVVKTNLAAIGIEVAVERFPLGALFGRISRAQEPFDIAMVGWAADAFDPANFIGVTLDARTIGAPDTANYAHFSDPVWTRRLDAAARLSGPARYIAYRQLATSLAREAAPWVVYGNAPVEDFFSNRVGCRVYQPLYGIALGALCLR